MIPNSGKHIHNHGVTGVLRAKTCTKSSKKSVRIALDEQAIEVRLRTNPRARRFTLRVPSNGETPVLTMPANGSEAEARTFLERHRDWLKKRLAERPDRIAFEDGAAIPIRGQTHYIEHCPGRRGTVWLDEHAGDRLLCVTGNEEHLARRVTDWLRAEARRDLEPAVLSLCETLHTRAKSIRIGDPKTRWGSCSTTGRLSFSWRLIMAPSFVLKYLAAHEVAHFKEMNHSDRFWKLTRELSPETDQAEAWLKAHGRGLHRYG